MAKVTFIESSFNNKILQVWLRWTFSSYLSESGQFLTESLLNMMLFLSSLRNISAPEILAYFHWGHLPYSLCYLFASPLDSTNTHISVEGNKMCGVRQCLFSLSQGLVHQLFTSPWQESSIWSFLLASLALVFQPSGEGADSSRRIN